MIAIKLLGGALIVLACVFFGREATFYEKIKLGESEAFLNLIRHIKNEISLYRTPIPKIISSYASKELYDCGFLQNFDISWNGALKASLEKLHIDEDVKKLLFDFGKELGGPSTDEQINSCEYYAEKLSDMVEVMKSELPVKQKMYRSLSAVLGIIAVIILF